MAKHMISEIEMGKGKLGNVTQTAGIGPSYLLSTWGYQIAGSQMAAASQLLPGEVGCLAQRLEALKPVRNRMLTESKGYFTRWVNDEAIGVKSCKAMSLNACALEVAADWWCAQFPTMVTAAKIHPFREEVGMIGKNHSLALI